MTAALNEYAPIVGPGTIEEIHALGRALRGRRVLHVNSTAVGGGVAETLQRMVPLMNEAGVETEWWVMEGKPEFFAVTKSLHNALQGNAVEFTKEMRRAYDAAQEANRRKLPEGNDVVIIHDPQPAGLLTPQTRRGAKWIWRCHIDLSSPHAAAWEFLRPHVEAYDASVFSSPKFARAVGRRMFLIAPSIDPLSEKNRDLDAQEVRQVLEKHSLDPDRPILTQVSRFDLFKDPFGVIKAYRAVKVEVDVQLVLAGGGATDDPEGAGILAHLREEASRDPDLHVLNLPPDAHREINALQRGSTIVFQKSTREGFGLTVTEALWKGKPVIGGRRRRLTHRVGFVAPLQRHPMALSAFILDSLGKDEEGRSIDALVGATAMEEYNVRLDLRARKLDLSRFRREFIEYAAP